MNSITNKTLGSLGLLRLAAPFARGRFATSGDHKRDQYSDLDELITTHFEIYSDPAHPCRPTLTLALELLDQRPALIVETGSSAWGTNSTMLFDSYCNSFGGRCDTVDIRLEPMLKLKESISGSTHMHCDDSVSFIKRLATDGRMAEADLLYLDSWDVNWADPIPSAIHGLNEYLEAIGVLKQGALVLIDDTPRDIANMMRAHPTFSDDFQLFVERFGFTPGKGSLIKKLIESTGRGEILAHEYQLLVRV
jgi:hypothetical protein